MHDKTCLDKHECGEYAYMGFWTPNQSELTGIHHQGLLLLRIMGTMLPAPQAMEDDEREVFQTFQLEL